MRLGDDGRLVILRSAPPEDPVKLRATAATLRAAVGAGAVEIVSFRDDGDGIELAVAFAGRSPSAPMDGRALARVAGAVAANVADLHLRGIAHGALVADHVLVDAAGTVRLCGFGSSSDGSPADDVDALGTLLHTLLDDGDTSDVAGAIRSTIERCHSEPIARPSMAAIAAALASAHGPRATIGAVPPPAPGRPKALIAIAVGIALIIVALLAWPRGSTPAPEIATPIETTSSTSTTLAVVATRIWPRSSTSTIEGAGSHWRWDSEGVSVIGDWDCDGVDTPALLASGALWLIDDWPTGAQAQARLIATVDDAIDARVDRGPSCDAILISTREGVDVRPDLRVTPA